MPSTNNDFIVIQNNNDVDKIPQYKQTIPVNLYHFYIIDEIGDPSKFLDLINTLKTAEEHDTIFIYLNTPGGSLQTTVQIISAMKQCAATVVTCLEGEVCSAGTLIFLAGTKHVVNPNCTFMIHNYSQWLGGKGNEVALRVKYSEQFFKKLSMDVYKGFMTDEEIQSVIDGKDYWMDSEEVIRRINARNESAVCEPGQVAEEAITNVVDQYISEDTDDDEELGAPSPPKTKKYRNK